MKLLKILPATLPLVLSLPALAHIDPMSKLPAFDAQQTLAQPDSIGPVVGTWMQDAHGFGRLTGELIGQNGGARLLLDALIEPDRNSLLDNPMLVGVVRGQLYHDDGTDPLFAQSDLYVLGTFAVLPDYGEASCLILRYQGTGPVEVIGQFKGTLALASTQPMVLKVPGSDSDAVQQPAADAVGAQRGSGVQLPDNDAVQPVDDAAPVAPGAPQVDHTLVAPFSGRWRIYA